MKTIFSAAMLLALYLLAFTKGTAQSNPGEEVKIGYSREYIKLRDKQVSPMLYIANLNGLEISYGRITPKNQWLADIRVGMGDLVAPSLGIRQFTFSEDQEQPLFLAPTLYRGDLSLTYRRKLQQKGVRASWAGIQIQENFNYADGLAMTTWVMNSLTLNITYQTEFQLNKNNRIIADASLPVLTAVSRLPYSNAISRPDMSNASAFLKNTSLESVNSYINPQLNVGYRFTISNRFALQAIYTYQWLHFSEPRLIRAASHTGNLSFIYQYHFQYK